MKTSGIFILTMAGLLAPSFLVFFRGASGEPYTTFRVSDAVVQIGVASALIALWVVFIGFLTVQVAKKKLHPVWLSASILGALAILGLYQSPAGYISDLVHFGVVR